jgi:DNA polymerase-3 subunit epsilon
LEPGLRPQDHADHGGEGLDAQERVLSVYLKPRWAQAPILWEGKEESPGTVVGPETSLDDAEFVALDVETTGNSPFLVLEIGAERFRLDQTLSLFDTLVDCRAPINAYAHRRHRIRHDMLAGAPGFADARRAFLHFARGGVLVEHSHDAFDSYLIGRGLRHPLRHAVVDTSALARLVLGLPQGQTPGLAWVVAQLGVDANPAHAALSDAQATAAVFRELVDRGRQQFGWECVGHLLTALPRPEIDRSLLGSTKTRSLRTGRRDRLGLSASGRQTSLPPGD